MTIAKKTGLYISPVNQPIIEKVMADYGYTKISNAINFIIQEYDRMKNENKNKIEEPKPVEKKQSDLLSWFVVGDK